MRRTWGLLARLRINQRRTFLILALLLLATPAKTAEGLRPESMSALEGYAIECGKAAQLGRWAGIDTNGHATDFLMLARRNGASYPQIGRLELKYANGAQYAARRGYIKGRGQNVSDEDLESIQRSLVSCLTF